MLITSDMWKSLQLHQHQNKTKQNKNTKKHKSPPSKQHKQKENNKPSKNKPNQLPRKKLINYQTLQTLQIRNSEGAYINHCNLGQKPSKFCTKSEMIFKKYMKNM